MNTWLKILKWSEKYTQTDMAYVMHGGLLLLLGKTIILLILGATMIAFANWLPKTSYGIYEYVLTLMVILGLFSMPGLNTALVRSIAKKKEGSLALILKTKFRWSLLGSLGMFLLAGWYAFQGQTLLGIALGIGGLFLPLYTVLPMFEAYWNGKKRFGVKARYEVIVAFLAAAFIIPTVYLTHNIIIILSVCFASYTVLNGFFLWRTLRQTTNTEEDPEAIGLGKSLTGIMAVWTLAEYMDKIILWKFLGPAQLAIYAFASQPLQRIIAFNPMGALTLPKISEGDPKEIYGSLMKKFVRSFAVTIPAAAGLVLIAPVMYRIFFPQYMESVMYFQALSALIAMTPFVLINTALVVEMQKKQLYIVNFARATVKIALYLILVPFLNIWGIIIGRIVGNAIANILLLYFFTAIRRARELREL